MQTVPSIWQAAVSEPRSRPAFLVREADGTWNEVGWPAAGRAVEELATGFLALGIERGDRVAILSRTRLEWTLCDYALATIGVVTVPIYPTASAFECAYVIGNSSARAIVCEDAEQYAKIAPVRTELDAVDRIITIEGAPGSALALDELRARGREALAGDPGAARATGREIAESDVLTIIYTSGTTGPPKGCVITQRNYWRQVEMVRSMPGLFAGHDTILLHLPLAHNFARLVQHLAVATGSTLAFCPDIADVSDALVAVRPTLFPSVPRLFEKVHTAIQARFRETTGVRGRLVESALRAGRDAAARKRTGGRFAPGLAVRAALGDRLVLQKVRARFGGRLRYAVSGGAPLAAEIAEFFEALGITILEGYGLTEMTTASHINRPGAHRFGTVGTPLEGIEARTTAEGEILLRGDTVFAGYWGDEAATRSALSDDGWLRTGDIGSIDADGYLTITDRKKDIIITAGGKNVSPQNIQRALEASPAVSQALVVGDRRPYLVALLVPDRDEIERVGGGAGETRALLERVVAEVNHSLGRVEQIKRFAVLERHFLSEQGELTPTLKLRRHVCEEHFRDEIERLYADAASADLGTG